MKIRSYLYPNAWADDRRTQFLAPDEADKHERWLVAVKDRAPIALPSAKGLVAELRAQTDKTIHLTPAAKQRISGDPDVSDLHCRKIFAAGLISGWGLGATQTRIQLCLF